jgi:hemolysin activation/secretion protein
MALLAATTAQAQVNSGAVTREIEKTLPSLPKKEARTPGKAPSAQDASSAEKQKRPIEDMIVELPEEDSLASPITKIVVSSSVLRQEITDLIRDQAFNKRRISKEELASVRQKIWNLGLKNKKLLHTKFKVVPNPKEDKKSWIIVTVSEIAVRRVLVTPEGEVRQAVLDDIQREASREFYEEKILDLNELDNTIKSRLRLGDVRLRTTVVPIDETHMDLKVVVSSVSERAPSALIQYDNAGGWAFGRDRLLGAVSFRDFLPGDELGFIAMKTADVGNMDFANGMWFVRSEYEVPIGEWGVRFNLWGSGLHYHEVRSTTANTDMNGEVLEFGQGVIKPLYTDQNMMLDGRAEFVTRYMVDRIFETSRSNEKAEYAGRLKAMMVYAGDDKQVFQLNLWGTFGTVDLSGNKQALLQDQAGPKANGVFSKLEGEGTWTGRLGEDDKLDFRLVGKGQWAFNNLDSVEQFSLGGSTGLRAFGSGEASGDRGFMFNGDLGYSFDEGIRPFVLYDVGGIWKSVDPWIGEGGNLSYFLQNVGLGVSMSFGPVDLNTTFAHQVGPNPGLSAQGVDIDSSKQHYRVWSSISYKY